MPLESFHSLDCMKQYPLYSIDGEMFTDWLKYIWV